MSEEQKETPVRTLLQDIRAQGQPLRPPPRGLISPKLVSRVAFFTSVICLFLSTVVFLVAVWGSTDGVFAFRSIISMAVIVATIYLFGFINSQFE